MRVNRLHALSIPRTFQPPLHNVASEEQDDSDEERGAEQETEYSGLKREGEHRGPEDDDENGEAEQVDSGERAGAPLHMAPGAADGGPVGVTRGSEAMCFHVQRMIP